MARAQTTATVPTSQPTTQSATSGLQQPFDRLADPDPLVREQAAMQLMLATPAELKELIKAQPAIDSQRAAQLQRIAVHAHAAASHGYVVPPGNWVEVRARLGIRIPENIIEDDNESPGLLIRQTTIGFDAYRVLRPGDQIQAVRFGLGEWVGIRDISALRQFLTKNMIGQSIDVRFVRDAQVWSESIRVGAMVNGNTTNSDELDRLRIDAAMSFWRTDLLPIVRTKLPK
jgi:hypothetical protein